MYACLAASPINDYSYGLPYNCTKVDHTSDTMADMTCALIGRLVLDACLWLGSTNAFY